MEKVLAPKLLGLWISEDLDWELNTSEMFINAHSRISLLCKLKYVGMSTEDLLKTYISFKRCLLEYACVVWHSTLTVNQTCALERVQKILSREYIGYEAALKVSNLETLEMSVKLKPQDPITLFTTITLENRICSQLLKPGRRG